MQAPYAKRSDRRTTRAIAIDLGVTKACIATWRTSGAQVILNQLGDRTTPSGLSVDGMYLWHEVTDYPSAPVLRSGRFAGRKFEDLISHSTHPYLCALKQAAQDYLGGPVSGVVLIVPSYLTLAARLHLSTICSEAGLPVLRMMSPGMAIALTYALKNDIPDLAVTLVFSCGASALDVTVVRNGEGVCQAVSRAYDGTASGDAYNQRILQYIVGDIARTHMINVTESPETVRRILTVCEHAKCTLSTSHLAYIELCALPTGIDYHLILTRKSFEALCDPIFQSVTCAIDIALDGADLCGSDVATVIVVGGCTKIPKLQQILRDRFPACQLDYSLAADAAAAAYSAALEAASLAKDYAESTGIVEAVYTEVPSQAIGVGMYGGTIAAVFPADSPVPGWHRQLFTNTMDGQSQFFVPIMQGAGSSDSHCEHLGDIHLSGSKSYLKGEAIIEVSVLLDLDNRPSVTVSDLVTGQNACLNLSGLSSAHIRQQGVSVEHNEDERGYILPGTPVSFVDLHDDAKLVCSRWQMQQWSVELC